MKIAFLLRYWPFYGGGETVTRVLVEEFLRRGVEIHILYWWSRNEGRKFEPSGKYYEYRFDVPESNDYLPKSDISWLKKKLNDYLLLNKIDFVINQWWPAGLVTPNQNTTIIRCWHTNIKSIIEDSRIFIKFIKKIYNRIFIKKIYKQILKNNLDKYYIESDILVFLAETYQKEFCKYSSLYPQKGKTVTYIHNPLTYYSVPEINIDDKKKEVIFVGRIEEPVKRISRILYAWKNILDAGITDWVLYIIGDGPDLGVMQNLAAELGLINIIFTGAKDPRENYRTASILLLTSDIEGWPMTIVEGKSYGVVPVVMNTYAAAKDVVNHTLDGLVCSTTDINDFSKMIILLMKDKKMRRRYALEAMVDSQKYHVEKIVDQWQVLLNEHAKGNKKFYKFK